jgi:hypothetical protein
MDRNCQNTINMKVNKYDTVSLINQLIWDWDVDVSSTMEGVQKKFKLKTFWE